MTVPTRRVCIHQPTYLPWLGFFDKLLASDVWVVLDDAELTRQSWITRVYIKSGATRLLLAVPVLHKFSSHAPLRDIHIDDSHQWRRKHERSLRQAYARAPHRLALEPLLALTYASQYQRLIDLTMAGLDWLRSALGIAVEIVFSSQLAIGTATGSERLVRLTQAVGGHVYVTGGGSHGYLQPELFQRAGVGLEWQDYAEQSYAQVGGGEFIGGLSALDALANLGVTATAHLLRSAHRAPRPAGLDA